MDISLGPRSERRPIPGPMTKPKLSRERRRQLRNLAAGLCERCSKPRLDSRFCRKHRAAFRERNRLYMRKRRSAAAK